VKPICDKFLFSLLAAIAFCLVGCQGAQKATQESHEHFPPHWPQTIFSASDRLSQMLQQPDIAPTADRVPPQQEFMDLIGWLPILTADSDLDRSTFDRIDAASVRLHDKWQGANQPQDLQSLVNDSEVRELVNWMADVFQKVRSADQQLGHSPG
jgi:hypothetical protein